jgi:negative regulator of flagellin synthesis FlgM
MEIDGKNPLVGLSTGVERLEVVQQPERSKRTSEEKSNGESDRIEFSVQGRDIQRLDELIRSTPDIRQARVDQVRGAIENGTYNVKAEKIADKMIVGSMLNETF